MRGFPSFSIRESDRWVERSSLISISSMGDAFQYPRVGSLG